MAQIVSMPAIFDELPAPQRPVMTPELRYRRARRFAVVLNWFVLGYSFLHKFALPVYVTKIAHSPSFAVIDWWWLYHVALGVLLLRKDWDDALLRLSAFFGIGGAACQIIVSFRERNWHSVSLWVTSASTLWVVFFLLSKTRWRFPAQWKAKKIVLKAASLALGFFVQFALFGFTLNVEKNVRQAKAPAVIERLPALSDPNVCGAVGFSLPLDAGIPKFPGLQILAGVSVKDCGFPAAMARFDPSEALTVTNTTAGYLNVKLYIPFEGRWRPLQNMPLPPGLQHELTPALLAGHPVVLVASDADPKKGILLLVASPEALAETVKSLTPPDRTVVQIDRRGISFF